MASNYQEIFFYLFSDGDRTLKLFSLLSFWQKWKEIIILGNPEWEMSLLLQSEDVNCSDLFRQCFISCVDKITYLDLVILLTLAQINGRVLGWWDVQRYSHHVECYVAPKRLYNRSLRENVMWKLSCILSGENYKVVTLMQNKWLKTRFNWKSITL